jgi:hypothetical protein
MEPRRFTQLISFWRSVEALSPQTIPKVAPSNPLTPVRNWPHGALVPWCEPAFVQRRIPPAKAWRHSIYGAVYERATFIRLLEFKLGKQPDVFEERANGECAVFYLAVDEHGYPQVDSLTLSMAAWAYGIIERQGLDALDDSQACDVAGLHAAPMPLALPPANSGFPGFDTQTDALREELAWRIGALPDDGGIDGAWLASFSDLVVARLGLATLVPPASPHRIRSAQITRPKPATTAPAAKADDDFMNSFFIRDLNRIAAAGASAAGRTFIRYLDAPAGLQRVDVRTDRARARALLDPHLFPQGCWPAAHPLVWSQQLAINALWQELQQDCTFAVNGPPGTGKTTLLRDVVAAVVVERAKVLARKGRHAFGERCTIDIGGRKVPYFALTHELAGHSIVVASSNNGAVENLSLELPAEDAIDAVWAGRADLYADIASGLLTRSDDARPRSAWALIAGRLGNKANRNAFSSTFWWQTSDGGKVPGLRERLDDLKSGKANAALPWDEALAAFTQALDDENAWRERLGAMAQSSDHLARLGQEHAQAQVARDAALAEQRRVQGADGALILELEEGERHARELQAYLDGQRDIRPGWLDWLRTFGRAQREWRARVGGILDQRREHESANAAIRRQRKLTSHALAQCDSGLQRASDDLARLGAHLAHTQRELQDAQASLGPHWPHTHGNEADQERSSPWAHPDWRSARIEVFIAALNLHRAFIEDNAVQMQSNLGLAMYMLSGAVPDPDARALALDSLALACPVISTTFASAASLFGEMKPGGIGWLLIDEAGQAPPQAAAGAIWRATRTVVVGDPLQLEPVVTLPRSIEASLAACHGGIGAPWLPTQASVQTLADRTTPVGTQAGPEGSKIWVGAPLRVHRRCDDPMFSISNAIAYDGLMVHQKTPSPVAWPASGWIDVPRAVSEGNWVPAEGDALRALLKQLIQVSHIAPGAIFLISPFRDVVQHITRIGKQFGLESDRMGTVHTTQGKEADVVIVVVGGGSAGARDWVVGKPNLLNVAVSRARARLYLIGDRRDLAQRPYFDVLARRLPIFTVGAATQVAGSDSNA